MRIDQILPGIAALRPEDVQAYLRSRGWAPVPDARAIVAVYANVTGDEILVPLDRSLGDYNRRMAEGIETLALLEKRTPQAVLEDLTLPPGDVFSFRIQSDLVSSGTILLDDAIRLREAQKNLLLAAAHSVVFPQRYFPRMGRAEPLALLSSCREGQTARGSYISTLLIPVEPAVGRLPLEDPYGRQVSRLLMETLQIVRGRLIRAEHEELLAEPARGLSYNFLAALAEMRPRGEQSTLDVSLRWSRTRAGPAISTTVQFNEPQFAAMQAIARALREQTSSDCDIEGHVTRLTRAGSDPNAAGEVVLLAMLGDHPVETRVHVKLPSTAYNDHAVPAHQQGRRVRVSGLLQRDGRRWLLQEASGFRMLPGEEE